MKKMFFFCVFSSALLLKSMEEREDGSTALRGPGQTPCARVVGSNSVLPLKKKKDVAFILLEGKRKRMKRVKGSTTPLHTAASNSDMKTVHTLAGDWSVDVNAQDEAGRTPLHHAVARGHREVVQALLGAPGIQNTITDDNGDSVLHVAIKAGNEQVLEDLLEENQCIYATNKQGYTPLEQAILQKKKRMIEALLNVHYNSVVTVTDDPLFFAVQHGDLEVLKWVFEHPEVNVHAQNLEGQNILQYAMWSGSVPLVKHLLAIPSLRQRNRKGDTILHIAAQRGRIDLLEALLDAGLDVNARGYRKQTPLHCAVGAQNVSMVAALLEIEGIDLTLKRDDGRSALQLAAEEGYMNIVKLLIRAGADVGLEPAWSALLLLRTGYLRR